jgi:hypothetical protein
MNTEYVVWLLVVALAVGGWLFWLVQGRLPREDDDLLADERAAEAAWIDQVLASEGEAVGAERVAAVLELHRRYLAGQPMEMPPVGSTTADAGRPAAAVTATAEPVTRPATPPTRPIHDRHDPRREPAEADVRQPG